MSPFHVVGNARFGVAGARANLAAMAWFAGKAPLSIPGFLISRLDTLAIPGETRAGPI
jgi:hypothetical protein